MKMAFTPLLAIAQTPSNDDYFQSGLPATASSLNANKIAT